MPAPKGTIPPAAGKGRVKGSQNKITADVKAMIERALEEAGGYEYLLRQASENPVAFMSLVGKLLPKDINANVSGTIALRDYYLKLHGASD